MGVLPRARGLGAAQASGSCQLADDELFTEVMSNRKRAARVLAHQRKIRQATVTVDAMAQSTW
jgi:hypothetical protein